MIVLVYWHFILGVSTEATEEHVVQSKFNISCTGTIGKGKPSLDINVKIDGETGLGGLLRLGKENPPRCDLFNSWSRRSTTHDNGKTSHWGTPEKESTMLGIGRAEIEREGIQRAYIVGRYKPAGNMMGSYPTSVSKGNFNPSYCNSVQSKR